MWRQCWLPAILYSWILSSDYFIIACSWLVIWLVLMHLSHMFFSVFKCLHAVIELGVLFRLFAALLYSLFLISILKQRVCVTLSKLWWLKRHRMTVIRTDLWFDIETWFDLPITVKELFLYHYGQQYCIIYEALELYLCFGVIWIHHMYSLSAIKHGIIDSVLRQWRQY